MKKPIPSLSSVPVTPPSEGPVMARPNKPARESLHVRVTVETAERVREAAHRLRRDKQDITEEALIAWLAERGL